MPAMPGNLSCFRQAAIVCRYASARRSLPKSPGMPISAQRSFEPISSTSTPGTAAISSALAIAVGVSSMTTVRLAVLSACAASPVDTERELFLFELLAGDVADGTHRRLPQIWRCRGGCRLAGDWASGRPDVGRERIKRSGRSGGGVDPPPAVSVFAGGELRRRRLSGSLLLGRDRRELTIALGGDLAQMRDDAAGPGGDQASDDDVLLQPLQVVDTAGDRRLCEDAGCLLERGR